MKLDQLSSTEQTELIRQSGSDVILQRMLQDDLPLTREMYLELNYESVPEEGLSPEAEAEMPELFRLADD
jgi:hypothetical protein